MLFCLNYHSVTLQTLSTSTSTSTISTTMTSSKPLISSSEPYVPPDNLEVVETNEKPEQSIIDDHVTLEDFQKLLESQLRPYFDEFVQAVDISDIRDSSSEMKRLLDEHQRRISSQMTTLIKERVTTEDLDKISNLLKGIMDARKVKVSTMDASLAKIAKDFKTGQSKLENVTLLSNKEIGDISRLLSSILDSRQIDFGHINSTLSKMSYDSAMFRQEILQRMDDMDGQINAYNIGGNGFQNNVDCNITSIGPSIPNRPGLVDQIQTWCIFFIAGVHVMFILVKLFR